MSKKPELTDLIEKVKFSTGLTQEQIAERLGYSRSYLSQAIGSGGNEKIVSAVKKEFKTELENLTKSVARETVTLTEQEQRAIKKLAEEGRPENQKPDLLQVIADSFLHQKDIDLLREQNRAEEIKTRNTEATNVSRLITILEKQQLSSFEKAELEGHSAKLYGLEEYVLRIGQELHHTDRKTESVALGKLVGEGFRLGEDTYTTPSESEGIQHKEKNTEKDRQR